MEQNSPEWEAREAVLRRLISAVVSPLPFVAAAQLSTEAGVVLCHAASATLLSPRTPMLMSLVNCRADTGRRVVVSVSTCEESGSAILDDSALLRLVPPAALGLHRRLHRWPDLLAALILDFASEDDAAAAARLEASLPVTAILQQVLRQAADHPVLFPNTEHLAAMAEFAAGAAHEINNPLSSIVGQTQLLLRQETSIDRRQALETIGSQAWRIRDMIGNTMLFARPPEPEFHLLDLVEITRQTIENLMAGQQDGGISAEFRCAEPSLTVEADRTQVRMLLSFLIRNAVEAIRGTSHAGRVSVILKVSRQWHAAEIIVRDSGPGIHDDPVRRHLFDPFFSGRQSGRGLGFGLSLCWQIVRSHHGLLYCHSPGSSGSGAEFHIVLPLRQDPQATVRSGKVSAC